MVLRYSFPALLLLLLHTGICVTASLHKTARLGLVGKLFRAGEDDIELPSEFVTYYYTQTLDHFNYKPESYTTFQQRYIMNNKYWGGSNNSSCSSPIFVYTGDEASITRVVNATGFTTELASHFNALLVYIEHRYYGDSVPFGSNFKALNTSELGFFSSTQALADYAQLVTDLKRNLTAEHCPIIAVGGSYGGMLASWFRLKYPHIIFGALASSAPVLYFDDITPQNGYHSIVTSDFRETSESCYDTIRQSWSEIDRVAAEPNGLLTLGNIFSACEPLNSTEELKDNLAYMYVSAAQHDNPPDKPVLELCNAIDGAIEGTSILGRIAAGLNVSRGSHHCHYIFPLIPNNQSEWTWQRCTEMVMPIGYGANETMFQASPFDLNNYTRTCEAIFGVSPRPHWITTEFGGHDINAVLKNFASNIIFSNGLRDPWSAGGVLRNISDSVVAVYTQQGSHCLDLHAPLANDPVWLVSQRDAEIKIIEGWIAEYNAKHS